MGDLYNRKLLNSPDVRLAFSDPLYGITQPSETDVILDNSDRYFDAVNVIGERLDLWRFDKFSSESQWELTGLVTSQEYAIDSVRLSVVAQDLADLQTLLPRHVVTAATFPYAHPTLGLGKPIPIIIGNAASTHKVTDAWEMWYVGENIGSNQYDLLVGKGSFTNITAYRMTVGDTLFIIPPGEYTVNTTAYPGYTVLRFTVKPVDFGGSYDRRFVAADGLSSERNGATAIKSLLSDSTWGLGLSVNAASFTQAASDWDAVGGLYVDMAITEQRPALDWINEIAIMRGLWPDKNSSGEWTLSVMKSQSALKAILGHGIGQQRGGVVDFGGLTHTPLSEAIKSLVVKYRYNQFQQEYTLMTAARTPFSYGKERTIESLAIRDRTTGDKTACFLAKRLQYGDQSIACSGDLSCRQLRPGDLFQYEALAPVFTKIFMVQGLRRDIIEGKTSLDGVGWDANIFTYDALTLPAEPSDTTPTDYTRSTPTAASSLSVTASGVETNDQGVKSAYMVLQYTVPDEPWAVTLVKYTKDGETLWTALSGENGNGVKTTKIPGLVGSQIYDLRVVRANAFNPTLAATADLANQTAPGDTTAPSDPTAITVRQAGARVVEITITATPPSDWGTTIFYRNTTNNSGTATEIGRGKTKRWTDQEPSYGTTYYYWAKVADASGNLSGFSPSSGHSITISQIVTADVGTGAIATGNVAGTAITTAKRQLQSSDSFSVSISANSFQSYQRTHNLGVIPNCTMALDTAGQWASGYAILGTTNVTCVFINTSASEINGTATLYYW